MKPTVVVVLFVFWVGLTTRATWSCPQTSKNQRQPVSHVSLTARMPGELKKIIPLEKQETQNEPSCQQPSGLTARQKPCDHCDSAFKKQCEKKNATFHANLLTPSDGACTSIPPHPSPRYCSSSLMGESDRKNWCSQHQPKGTPYKPTISTRQH